MIPSEYYTCPCCDGKKVIHASFSKESKWDIDCYVCNGKGKVDWITRLKPFFKFDKNT
jgi:transcription elongation factor Elf1